MPQTTCVVPECSNAGDHIIPQDPKRQKTWIHAIRRGKTRFEKWTPPSKYSYVCRAHFVDDDYISVTFYGSTPQQRRLKRTAVPSQFNWNSQSVSESVAARRKRVARRMLQQNTNLKTTQSFDHDAVTSHLNIGACEEIEEESSVEVLEDKSTCDTGDTVMSNAETQTPRQHMFHIENFRNDDEGILFYTGLEDISKFYFVLHTLGPAAYCLNYAYHSVTSVSVPDQLFLTLIKLRRHTTNFELSRMFGISESTVANIIFTWICFMYHQWKEINIWPPQELVRYFLPSGFKQQFPNTRVIIDGTECPIKKPQNPKSQQATFSTYKNRNTVKVLVGATPGGLVSFVSESYAGSTSDRQIVERSNLMNLCEPKDSIMADKGFNVQDLFANQDVTVNIPKFFKRKNRLCGDVVLHDRKIASKRVHIERLIGLAKTFKVLTESMTGSETNLSREIIFVCFMLCNFRNCIMPN